jgi:small subunit ribosomal protein S4
MKLFLKGERCHTEKCAIEKRNIPPGAQVSRNRRPKKLSGFGLQLREKQKARRVYGVLERQFRRYYDRAARMKGITGENLLSLLERRLDNVVYRLGFGTSRNQARQLVRHGHILVNGRKVNIPSFQVKQDDAVEVKAKSHKNPMILSSLEATAHQPTPSWLEVDRDSFKGRVIGAPRRDELVQIQMNEQLIVELYSK